MKINSNSHYIYWVVFLGLAIRLIAWTNTYVVNPDGTLYINQAKAIYYGQTQDLSCGDDFAANYAVMIAGIYAIAKDWIFAGRFVSLLFGTATLIPLYFLLRRHFDAQISALCTLIFAMLPVSVGSSVDIIRDPVCWFFLTLGLYFYTKGSEENSSLHMLFSSLSFLMAAWFRIEASLFLIVSLLYLFFVRQDERVKKSLYFAIPIIFSMAVLFLYIYITKDTNVRIQIMLYRIVDKFISFYDQYKQLLDTLKTEAFLHRHQTLGLFISESRTNVWLIPIGMLLNRFLETFLYIFACLFAIGLFGIVQHIKINIQVRYLVLLFVASVVLLYTHIVYTWWLDYRHIYIAIIPSFIFVGYGIDKIVQYVQTKLAMKRIVAISICALAIILSTLPKNLLARDINNITFKNIGEFIANREGGAGVISISTPINIHRWISFYANLSYQGVVCPEPTATNCWELNLDDYDRFIRHLKEQRVKYLVWTQKQWPEDRIDFSLAPLHLNLKELGRWNHPMTGEIILFEVD